jgi:hypothetical protein
MATSHRTLIWRADRQIYELDEQGGKQFFPLTGDEEQWVSWLESISAFSFQGQQGHLTVRKEARPRGDQYWYAYRRVGPRMRKKYLGRSTTLTLARLEEIAAAFAHAASSSLWMEHMCLRGKRAMRSKQQGKQRFPQCCWRSDA